jgi:class 3 adenylate cyclase/predicted ATPase
LAATALSVQLNREGGQSMTFEEILAQVREQLQRKGRISYRALKLQFNFDDDYLEGLKDELIEAERVAVDEGGKVLVWAEGRAQEELEQGSTGAKGPGAKARPPTRTPPPPPQSLEASHGAREAERRQLTVMFCDLVGSTALSEQLDPEELREVIRAYQEACAAVIARFDGHLAKYLGDGLLVYFGYPLAHEDDAQRAVRAGLGIVGAIRELPLPPQVRLQQPLHVRVGIHTGLVVAGEMGSGDTREPLAIVGETPNIAARLQGLAEPDTVVLSATTHRLVAGLFACQELGPQTLKGISAPLALYNVMGESEAQSRFEVAVSTGLTPLVGRDLEVSLLRERWAQAKGGEGQVVLLSGEPGIGKSRLVQVLKERVTAEGATRIELRCSPYHQNSALYPIIEHLQRLLQFHREESPQAKLETLQQSLARYRFSEADTLPLLAALLSLPHPEGVPPLTLSLQKQKQKTQEALAAWIMEETEQAAVYCAWEDLHWADPSTLELLTLLLDQVPTTRLLALLTFRPDFSPPWRARSHLTQLTLNRLGRPQVEAMVEQISGSRALPAEVVQQIVRKTDGVPLFVEELTKMVLESGLLKKSDGRYELSGPLLPLAIPTTLQDSLMARLDRLAPVREVAQLGATLGREFSYDLIEAVSPLDEATLQEGLRQLVEAELVYQRGLPPQATYLFKHALIQDTAYQSLLKSKRQQYHNKIADVLEERLPEITATQPELLAHHYTEAGLTEQALPYWLQAGQLASRRSANVEAVNHLTKALELLKALPDTDGRSQREITLLIALAVPLIAIKGHGASEVGHAYTRAYELCQQIEETSQLFPVLLGLRFFHTMRGELEAARQFGEQLLQLAQSMRDPTALMEAHYALGVLLYSLGEFTAAHAHFEQSIAMYDLQEHRTRAFLYGVDPGIISFSIDALVLWQLGYPDHALKKSHEALNLAQQLSHPYSSVYALSFAGVLQYFLRQAQAVEERAAAALRLASEHGFPMWLGFGTALRGWVLVEQGQTAEGISHLRQGLATWQATGAEVWRPYFFTLLAEAHGRVKKTEEGLALADEGLTLVQNRGERFCEAELCRLKGELFLQPGARDVESEAEKRAENYLCEAVELARRQNAKSLELRAAMSLSRLWQQQGKKSDACQLLAMIYGWFTEGFATADLQEAKSLLEKLSE